MIDNLTYDNAFANYSFTDGILWIEVKPEMIIDVDIAKTIVLDRLTMSGSTTTCVLLFIPSDVLILEPKALDYFISREGTKNCSALAIVTDFTNLTILRNLKKLFSSKEVPHRFFLKKNGAKLWLIKYLEFQDVD